jgi:hypothetical protein
MSADKEPLVGLDELARMLETYEGLEARRGRAAASRGHGARWTWSVAAGALVVGSSFGFGLGSSLTPSGSAASTPAGVGFVPDSGWTVLQSGRDATTLRPALAIASNVPLHPDDDARGIRTSSGLPYATLLGLPPSGILIVATFAVPPATEWMGVPFSKRSLPLRLRDATPFVLNGTQIRPDRPLGEYQLRARVNGRDIDLHFYFGSPEPSRAMITATQRQLDRLVVQPERAAKTVRQRALPLRPATTSTAIASPSRVVDRTLACTTGVQAGARVITVTARSGFKKGDTYEWLAQAVVDTPGSPLPSQRNKYRPSLAGMTTGYPPPPPLTSGALVYDAKLCKPTRASVAFTRRGLAGGVVSQLGEEVKCFPSKTVLIRVRAEFVSPTALTRNDRFNAYEANARIAVGKLAVRTPAGKPLVYAEVRESGKAWLFTARSCF